MARKESLLALCLIIVAMAGCFGSEEPEPGPDPEEKEQNGTQNDNGGSNPKNENETENPEEGNETGTRQLDLALADLVCDFTYPDNTTQVACENEFSVVEAQASDRPSFTSAPPWTCLWEAGDEIPMDISIHWDPVEDRYGVFYDAPGVEGTLNGLFYTRSGEAPDGNIQAVWYDGPSSGFVTLPEPSADVEENQGFVVRLYTHSYETETPALQDKKIRAYWSLFEDRPYPLQVIETDDGGHYFNEVEITDHATYPYDLGSFDVEGEDFDVTVNNHHKQNIRTSFNMLVVHQCTF